MVHGFVHAAPFHHRYGMVTVDDPEIERHEHIRYHVSGGPALLGKTVEFGYYPHGAETGEAFGERVVIESCRIPDLAETALPRRYGLQDHQRIVGHRSQFHLQIEHHVVPHPRAVLEDVTVNDRTVIPIPEQSVIRRDPSDREICPQQIPAGTGRMEFPRFLQSHRVHIDLESEPSVQGAVTLHAIQHHPYRRSACDHHGIRIHQHPIHEMLELGCRRFVLLYEAGQFVEDDDGLLFGT